MTLNNNYIIINELLPTHTQHEYQWNRIKNKNITLIDIEYTCIICDTTTNNKDYLYTCRICYDVICGNCKDIQMQRCSNCDNTFCNSHIVTECETCGKTYCEYCASCKSCNSYK
jgi:hypothetical protein